MLSERLIYDRQHFQEKKQKKTYPVIWKAFHNTTLIRPTAGLQKVLIKNFFGHDRRIATYKVLNSDR